MNDGIPKDLCSLNYITIDDTIQHIMTLGKGTLLAKVNIKSAFRLLPVHPADHYLLGMQWRDELFVDTCLPFGLRSAPKLFNIQYWQTFLLGFCNNKESSQSSTIWMIFFSLVCLLPISVCNI